MEKVYWRFARRRLRLYLDKLEGSSVSSDPIIAKYRFTNAYRASDRVSQKLIQVQYDPQYSDKSKEVFFRTLLFKLFNKLETWELVIDNLEPHSRNVKAIGELFEGKSGLYSAAYIQASPAGKGIPKARAHVELLGELIEAGFHKRIKNAGSLEEVFGLLKTVRSFGDFLAFQYAIDLNYSSLINFEEWDFVVPGPGALDGISKVFPGQDPFTVIYRMAVKAPDKMKGMTLFGRQLQPIDCQNLFCEVSKYTRVSHPHIIGVSGRTIIKQEYRPYPQTLPKPFFPPKWATTI